MPETLLRPLCLAGSAPGAAKLAGGAISFLNAELVGEGRLLRPDEIAPERLAALTAPRPPVAGLPADRPLIMGVLNITPDSFSDGRPGESVKAAVARGLALEAEGADIIDVGGESTRPGAEPVSSAEEQRRILPVISGLMAAGLKAPVSVDTRNAATARAAFAAGARLFNDVSALTHDPESLAAAAGIGATVCLMHSKGDPAIMQRAPAYDNVVSEVYDYLAARIEACEAAGLPRARIIADPGIGFGKTLEHNLALMRSISVFHGLGCMILIGVSRKRFIGTLTGVETAGERVFGSVGAAIAALAQAAQILRVHDVKATKDAITLWRASMFNSGGDNE